MDLGAPLQDWLYARPRDFVYQRLVQPAQAFMGIEASSGIVLLAAALVALIWANSPWDESYFDLWHTQTFVDADVIAIDLDLQHWVNDGLMTLFFLLMGLEIKRELVHGELSSPRRALLPAAGALGGMIVPALIYTAFNAGGEGAPGWGVPMATDIAFAVGVLSLLSRRVPFSVKVFLLALAIADDIGAIAVIAVFYTDDINLFALALSCVALASVAALNRTGVRGFGLYTAAGLLLWLTLLESGVHASIAGVLLGLLIPASSFYGRATFAEDAEDLVRRFRAAEAAADEDAQRGILAQMQELSENTEAPLDRLESALHPWVSFLIVPLFALANAGVHVSSEVAEAAVESPISQGVAAGLILGKPLGIFLLTWLAVRLRLCELPAGATWAQIFGVGMLGGIGFTVALLIAGLGFEEAALVDEAKLGILVASLVAGIVGFVFLWFATSNRRVSAEPEPA